MGIETRTELYCNQCQEAAGGSACTRMSMCGIEPAAAGLRDLLVYVTAGLAAVTDTLQNEKKPVQQTWNRQIIDNLVMSTVNVNFDPDAYRAQIARTIALSAQARAEVAEPDALPEASRYDGAEDTYAEKASEIAGSAEIPSDMTDIVGLRAMITYAAAGIAAYMRGAMELGHDDEEVHAFIRSSLAKTTDDEIRGGELIACVLETGRYGIRAMKLLEKARTEKFGTPSATEICPEVRENPGILVLGDSFRDLAELLRQSEGSGVDIYV